jgi:hypothetical protein
MRNIFSLFFFLFIIGVEIASSQSGAALHINQGSHYLTDRSGKPFFWMGDTEWELFHQLPVSDAKKLLLERKKQGFTVVQVMVTGVFAEWGIMKKIARDTSNEAWLNGDPSHINESYFRRMDSIVAYAATIDMILIVGVNHAQDVDHGRITNTNARPWARWLGSRYRNASNLIWSMYPHADTASMQLLHEIVEGIQEGDGGIHLITVHPDPSPKSSSFFYPAAWLSFNTLQTWNSGYINYSMVLADYRKNPIIPVINGEARYEEEDGTTSMDTRRAAYFSMLAGGFYSFGHQDNWRAVTTWKSWYASPGAKQMQIMRNIFKNISWWKLVPDSTILQSQHKENIAARSSEGEWLIAYLSKPEKISISIQYSSLFKQSKISWIDPGTGTMLNAEYKIGQSGISLDPPHWADAVLLVSAKK